MENFGSIFFKIILRLNFRGIFFYGTAGGKIVEKGNFEVEIRRKLRGVLILSILSANISSCVSNIAS